MQTRIINDNILRGYTTKETAFKVDDYPWGFRLRTSIHYWIETKPKLGDRFCSYTIDPRTGRACKPKCGTYSPFLYMYINEDGHVKHAGIDSYDKDYFTNRFPFIIEKIGERFISDEQKQNLRINRMQHVYASSPYELAKYSDEKKPVYKAWLKATLTHLKTCDFANLVDYPERPEEDNPDGEVKMIVTTREEKPAPDLSHSITVEKLKALLLKTLPGFNVEVSEYTIFGTYFKILVSAKGRYQAVSLSLNTKTLELQVQQYGGEGGQSVYKEPDQNNPNERFYAMIRAKVPFRRPACNERDVLNAIERFAQNYKKTLLENRAVLKYQDLVNYDELLKTA